MTTSCLLYFVTLARWAFFVLFWDFICFILYKWVFCLHLCMYMHHTHVWCPQSQKREVDPWKLGSIDGCEPPCGRWDSNWIPCKRSQCSRTLSCLQVYICNVLLYWLTRYLHSVHSIEPGHGTRQSWRHLRLLRNWQWTEAAVVWEAH